MNSRYRILKLKNGEEIITKILNKKNGKFTLEQPMIFRLMMYADPYTGMQKEISVLKDWIGHTNEKTLQLPEDEIISFCSPMEEATILYEKEKEKKLKKKKRTVTNLDDVQRNVEKEIGQILDNLLNNKNENNYNKEMLDFMKAMSGSLDEELEFDIEFELGFSSEEITDETTEDQINHPDYGNRWTDWSSDSREY
tara:strand:+ start:124 stop:711 length:588 start_codon:yes stop_codon:yes gene_type:complete